MDLLVGDIPITPGQLRTFRQPEQDVRSTSLRCYFLTIILIRLIPMGSWDHPEVSAIIFIIRDLNVRGSLRGQFFRLILLSAIYRSGLRDG